MDDTKIVPGIVNDPKTPTKPKGDEKITDDTSCSCRAEDGKTKFSDTEAEHLIEFEDALHNIVYVK